MSNATDPILAYYNQHSEALYCAACYTNLEMYNDRTDCFTLRLRDASTVRRHGDECCECGKELPEVTDV